MSPVLSRRPAFAVALAVVCAVVVFALSQSAMAAAVALAGGVAAALLARSGEVPAAEPDPSAAELLDAVEPVLLVREGRVALANRAARVLLGEQIVGKDARIALRHPAAAERLERDDALGGPPVALTGLGNADHPYEMRLASASGGGRVVHLVDTSARHAAERMRVDFVANASHELRTPLASILGFVETLSDAAGDGPGVRARFLGIIGQEARRMQRLVDDLISLSRIEADKDRAPSTPVDLADLIEATCAELRGVAGTRGEDLACAAAPDVPPVAGDAAQLSQLLHNLIGNALKYGRAGTPVRVELERYGHLVRLHIADRGDGVAPEHLPRLTERFYRVDAGRSRSLGGTGLGLAIVKHIVERHRGRLDIASRLGEGTTVTVTLPQADWLLSQKRNA